MQRALRPGDIPIAAKLASVFCEDADWRESDALMQFGRGRIRQRISGHDAADVLARDRFEQRRIKAAADSLADCVRTAIDRGLDGRLVRSLGPKARGAGVTHDCAFLLRDEQAISSGQRELFEPWCAALDCVRLDVESDRRVDDVMVVDLDETRE